MKCKVLLQTYTINLYNFKRLKTSEYAFVKFYKFYKFSENKELKQMQKIYLKTQTIQKQK